MDKHFAIDVLGQGDEATAASWIIGVSPAIFEQWPDVLHYSQVDRVIAACFRKALAEIWQQSRDEYFADARGEIVLEHILVDVSLTAIMIGVLPDTPAPYHKRRPASVSLPGPTPAEAA